MTLLSLTRDEAASRSSMISVERYDIDVDMTDLLEGERFASISTVTFTCATPGASTFVDIAADVLSATLNGVDLDVATAVDGRLPLPGLAERNVLVVEAETTNTAAGEGILRTVDPTDKLVYVWTSLETDEARRLWACFDQPDLKAPHRFTVLAPASWTVTSNAGPDSVEGTDLDDVRVWRFPDTPPLSTYVVVVNAGPFHEVRQQHDGYDLGFYCRQSLVPHLERDLDELVTLTRQGLAFFGEKFGVPFPQERYDQVFVPNLGGAMENWGCVTYGDGQLFRTPPTHQQRQVRAEFVFHEMAHMWFGDLVTMRWWDDLWLNEAFASWAANWGLANASEFTEIWSSFLALFKRTAYEMDMGPRRPPDPRRGPRRLAGDGQLRRDHLRQGPERAPPARRLHRRGRLRLRTADLLRAPLVGQHGAVRPDDGLRRGRRARPRRLDACLAGPGRHRRPHAGGRRPPGHLPRRRAAAAAPRRHRVVRRGRRRAGGHRHHAGRALDARGAGRPAGGRPAARQRRRPDLRRRAPRRAVAAADVRAHRATSPTRCRGRWWSAPPPSCCSSASWRRGWRPVP